MHTERLHVLYCIISVSIYVCICIWCEVGLVCLWLWDGALSLLFGFVGLVTLKKVTARFCACEVSRGPLRQPPDLIVCTDCAKHIRETAPCTFERLIYIKIGIGKHIHTPHLYVIHINMYALKMHDLLCALHLGLNISEDYVGLMHSRLIYFHVLNVYWLYMS